MLENTIDGLAKLITVKTTAIKLQITNGTVTSYDEYFHCHVVPYKAMITNALQE